MMFPSVRAVVNTTTATVARFVDRSVIRPPCSIVNLFDPDCEGWSANGDRLRNEMSQALLHPVATHFAGSYRAPLIEAPAPVRALLRPGGV